MMLMKRHGRRREKKTKKKKKEDNDDKKIKMKGLFSGNEYEAVNKADFLFCR